MGKDTSLQIFGCLRAPGGSGTVPSSRPERRKSQDSKPMGLSKPARALGRGLSYTSLQDPTPYGCLGAGPGLDTASEKPLGYSCSSWIRLGVSRALPWFLHPPPPHTHKMHLKPGGTWHNAHCFPHPHLKHLSLFSCYVVSSSLQAHRLQHTRLPCPPLSPRVCSSSHPLSR